MSGQEKKGAATAGVSTVEEGRERQRGGTGEGGDKESRAGAVCRYRRHRRAGGRLQVEEVKEIE